jgi:hypothetical protein
MKRTVLWAVLLLSVASAAVAELGFTRVSAVETAQTSTINAATLLVVNDGASEVYVRVFWEGETVSAATTSSTEIKSGEGFTFSRTLNIQAISIVCATGETATVRLIYW